MASKLNIKVLVAGLIIAISFGIIIVVGYIIPMMNKGGPCPIGQKNYAKYNLACGPEKCDKLSETIQPVRDKNGKIKSLVCCDGKICNNIKSDNYGKCIPNNACSSNDNNDLHYTNNDSCGCDVKCGKSGFYPSLKNADITQDSATKKWKVTSKNDDGSDIFCGQQCGDTKVCHEDTQICGRNIFWEGEINKQPDCFDQSKFQYFKNKNNIQDLVCNKKLGVDPDTGLCKPTGYCGLGDDADKVVACKTNTDCINSISGDMGKFYSPGAKCMIGKVSKDSTLTDKQILDVGYCSSKYEKDGKSLKIPYLSTLQNCVKNTQIGQDTDGNLKVCKPSESGLNAYYNCKNSCVSSDTSMCPNKFQQIPPGGNKFCMSDTGDTARFGICCPNPIQIDNKTYACCLTGNCFNDTKYPYSRNILGMTGTTFATDNDKISCTTDSDCHKSEYLSDLQTSLNNTTQSNHEKQANYATLFCKTGPNGTGYCHGRCGLTYTQKGGEKGPTDYVLTSADYSDGKNNISYCIQKEYQSGYQLGDQTYQQGVIYGSDPTLQGNNKFTIPICSDGNKSSDGNKNYYWTAKPDYDKQAYSAVFTAPLETSDSKPVNAKNSVNACVKWYGDRKDIINVSTKTQRGSDVAHCQYEIDCKKHTLTSGNKHFNWPDIKDSLKNKKMYLDDSNWVLSPPNYTKGTRCQGDSEKVSDISKDGKNIIFPMKKDQDECVLESDVKYGKLMYDGTYCPSGVEMRPGGTSGAGSVYQCAPNPSERLKSWKNK